MRHAWPSLIRPLARVVRPRLKLMRGKIEVYEKDGELLCGCRLTLESLRCTFSYNRRLGAMELYGERPAAFPQMLFRHFRKRADIKGLARQLRTDDQYSRQVVGHIAKRFCEIMMEGQNL